MPANPYQKFMEQSVSTMSPVQLIVALFDKSEQELKKAIYYIENNDFENVNKSLTKVQNIVLTLNGSLKMKYEISEQLSALYDYLNDQLVQANIHKDAEIIRQLIPFFSELKDSFVQVGKKGY
ncbi:MAG TPA: flagellar export chaperone FliS [Oscillospiraceae bacterium]|nr:flagellar export chaperone FliS [Oscillospiraceae bacterium]